MRWNVILAFFRPNSIKKNLKRPNGVITDFLGTPVTAPGPVYFAAIQPGGAVCHVGQWVAVYLPGYPVEATEIAAGVQGQVFTI
jgi:hypothetical protein